MPEALVLGNGSTLLGLDSKGRIQDMYYDYVGLEDHITPDAICKIGIWVDGKISWFADAEWIFDINYKPETLVGEIKAINETLGVEVTITDAVHNEKNVIIRSFVVHNIRENEREIKIFLNHQFRMYGVEKRDTVYFDPADNTIVHYKGRRVAVIGVQTEDDKSFDEFSVGLSNIEGKAGTWMDAEDGKLSNNPIEHGTVDSTVGIYKTVDANSKFEFSMWICLGKLLTESKELHKLTISKSPKRMIESAADYWYAWVNKNNPDFADLEKKHIELYKRSLLVIRTHVDNTGGIIASCDSGMLQYGRDNYSYIWPRDASFVAMALDRAGQYEASRKFYEFCVDTITADGYFFHKYRSDKALGSSWHGWLSRDGKLRLPIQEDETALVVSALWRHYELTKDLEFVELVYNKLIKKASDFLLGYRTHHMLPKPTYDLWEEKWGVHTFTVSTVYDALLSASKFANLLGKDVDKKLYKDAAGEIRKAAIKHLYNEHTNYFYKYIDFEGEDILHDATIDASSFYGAFKFDLFPADNQNLIKSYKTFKKELTCGTKIGGISRYVGDVYYQVSGSAPSNPWLITTLWNAQYEIKTAKSRKDLEKVKETFDWTARCTPNLSMLPEQINPYTAEGLSATPLIWSHAEYVTTVVEYLEKWREFEKQTP